MAVPDPPKPDELAEAIVASFFGADSAVLHLFVLGTFLLAWYSLARAAHRRGRDAYMRVSAIPAVRRARAGVYTLVTPAAQVAYLVLSWYIASRIEPMMTQYEGPDDVDMTTWLDPMEDPTGTPGFWIWFTISCGLVASGWWSAVGLRGDITPFHPIFWSFFVFGVVAALVLAALNPVMAGLALVYVVAAALALYLPRTCVRAWQPAA